jgi:CTP synthase
LQNGTIAHKAYQKDLIQERHRHRYEFNNKYKEVLGNCGLVFSGINPKTNLVEIIEIKDHPFFVASQFHPEFLSRPQRPHPLFREFIHASLCDKKDKIVY